MPERLPQQPGEWIDRSRPVSLRFRGQKMTAFTGDSIHAALMANGIIAVGRSMKLRRPRGLYSLANHDANGLFHDLASGLTNLRGDTTRVVDGMDLIAVNDDDAALSQVTDEHGPGWLYRYLHGRGAAYQDWEKKLRQLVGLGQIDPSLEPVASPKAYDFADVLVIGGGVAGMSAALAAAEHVERVVMVEEQAQLGANAIFEPESEELPGLIARVVASPKIDVRTDCVAAGLYADRWVALVDGERLIKLRASRIVIATGVVETAAVFPGNDLPGVMLAGAAMRLGAHYAVRACQRAVCLTNDHFYFQIATACNALDIDLVGQINTDRGAFILAAESDADGSLACVRYRDEHSVVRSIEVDGLLIGIGVTPADSLIHQAGGGAQYYGQRHRFIPVNVPNGLFVAGRVNGVDDFQARRTDGERAGLSAVASLGIVAPPPPTVLEADYKVSLAWPIFRDDEKTASENPVFIDFDEDVTLDDVEFGLKNGFDNINLLKRFSKFGTGPSQGKIANLNAMRLLARGLDKNLGEIGYPTQRPFYHPVEIGKLAGRRFDPIRRTALHDWHAAHGAVWMSAGTWLRPAYYGHDRPASIRDEVNTVRRSVGLIDLSTLGKVDVLGPDAGEFLDRLYTGRFTSLKVGRSRYGVMCDESGVVIDDGVIAKLGDARYFLTTTTAGAGSVVRQMQRWAIRWGMNVQIADRTTHLSAMNVTGPKSVAVMRLVCPSLFDGEPLNYLNIRQVSVCGVPAMLIRSGFVGEWGYEVYCNAHDAPKIWEGIHTAGQAFGLVTFGVEAQRVLRLEKAHLIVGQDTDGLTTPFEADCSWAVSINKPFFVGQRSLQTIQRKQLKRRLIRLLLHCPEGCTEQPAESNLVFADSRVVGRLTSVCESPTLGRWIALGMIDMPYADEPAQPIKARCESGAYLRCQIAGPEDFYDPANRRQVDSEAQL